MLTLRHVLLGTAAATAAAATAIAAGALPGAWAAGGSGAPGSPSALHVQKLKDAPVTRLIVRYRSGAHARSGEAVAGAAAVSAATLTGQGEDIGGGQVTVHLSRPVSRAVAEKAARQLAADPRVAAAEPDLRMQAVSTNPVAAAAAAAALKPASATSPNDTYYSYQWPLDGTYGVNGPQAWAASRGAGVVVAVLDTGITAHPELTGQTVAGYDMIADTTVSNDGDGRDADPSDPGDWVGTPGTSGFVASDWHGTHVTGTIAALTDNGAGVASVAPLVKVQPVRVLGSGGGYESDVAAGIYWAAGLSVSGVPANATPAKVISLSLGGSGTCDSTMQDAINAATAAGSTVVVAAGNENDDIANYSPASCQNVIVVAATTITGGRASYSNYGAVTLAAPGGYYSGTADATNGVLSTWNDGQTTPGNPDYAFADGTSMATPHVSAAAALLLAEKPNLTPAQVKARLVASARPLSGCSATYCGAGLLDAGAALPVNRLAGADRYGTSAAISAASYSPGVATAYIATGQYFPDALSGAPVAGRDGAPVLLVRPDAIPSVIAAELTRLNPGKIVILGGTAVVSSAVATQLGTYTTGAVSRLAGADRYGTSAAISAASYSPGASTVYIATGQYFPDALSGAPVAGRDGAPVLLVQPNAVPSVIAAELTRLNPGKIVILGGTAVVTPGVLSQLASFVG